MAEHKCDQCERIFGSSEGLEQHKRDKHGIGKTEEKKVYSPSKSIYKYVVLGVIALIIIGLGVFFITSQTQSSNSSVSKHNREIPKAGFHWHPKLDIYIKGDLTVIPANVGLGAVHQPIHTHDPDNILHYEFNSAPSFEQIRLGNFFRIWNKKFNRTCIFEYCSGENGTMKFYVNGVENEYYDDYIPYDLEKLEIRYE